MRIRCDEATGYLKISPFLHTRLASELHPADGELLKLAVKREGVLKLRGRIRIPVVSKRDGYHFDVILTVHLR